MGWTGIHFKPADPKAYVLQDYNFENETGKSTVLASAKVGNVIYAAVHNAYKVKPDVTSHLLDADNSCVYGLVILTRSPKNEFLWKNISEECGPHESNCPLKILEMLTPLSENAEWAKAWRKRCRENAFKPKTRTLKAGTVIKYATPLNFGKAGSDDTFERVDIFIRGKLKKVFYSTKIGYCRINVRNNPDFEVVGAA